VAANADREERAMTATRNEWRWVWRASLCAAIAASLSSTSREEKGVEKRHVGAGVGAVVGAGIGAVAGRDLKAAAAGAVIGGAVGYGVGWLVERYPVRKTRGADQVATLYGAPPASGPPKADNYRTWMDPTAIRIGTEAGQLTGNLQITTTASGAQCVTMWVWTRTGKHGA
jgi:hypothetical protein